ncbi:MAG TPA: hypothetical protein ENF53_01515 [Thermoprotei archaeon]|nr:hypothetical protein [Thermoprotei archaeon]
MPKVIWLHGMYREALKKGYGGGERSFHITTLISAITGYEIVSVVYKRPFAMGKSDYSHGNYRYLDLALTSKVERGILKIVRKLNLVKKRSAFRLFFLNPSKHSLVSFINETLERNCIVVFDSVKGYFMVKPLVEDVRKRAGMIIYLGHNFEADYYMNFKKWIMKAEREALGYSDLIIASSYRDAVRYEIDFKMDKSKILVFPNIYPVDFPLKQKFEEKTAVIVEGAAREVSSRIAMKLLECNAVNKLMYVGKNPPRRNDGKLIHRTFIEDRGEYLLFLSQAHIGINYGEWLGGSNVKRYDYVLAQLAVMSGGTGFRGEYLPGEIPFTDVYDLIAKIKLLDVEHLIELGRLNKEVAMRYYRDAVNKLKEKIETCINS